MAKSLSDILKGVKASKTEPGSTGSDPGVDYAPKAKAEQDFVAKHKTEKHSDRVGNTDAPYKASTKYVLDDEKEKSSYFGRYRARWFLSLRIFIK